MIIGSAVRDGLHSLQNLTSDDILAALGVEKRRSPVTGIILPSVALFIAGAAVGAAAAVLLSPKSGEALRRDLSNGARDIGNRLGATAQAVQEYVAPPARNHVGNAGSNATTT
ncbi:MAG: YtxH-like protein [Pseudomonadota bacterium]